MPITKEFYVDLDLKTATGNRDFTLVEGDTGNVIHVTLKDDGTPVDLTDCRVLAVFTKPTGSSMQDSAIEGGGVSIGGDAGNEVTISPYAASFGTGTNACELQIYSGEERNVLVTSAAFNFYCRNGIIDDDTIRATDEYPLLTSLIAQVQAIEDGVLMPADVDSSLSATSENPVQNKAVKAALDSKAPSAHTHTVSGIMDFPATMPPSPHTHTPASIGAAEASHTHTPASIGAAPSLQANVTYYVATTGSDTTGDGTSGNPFATVNKALSMLPKNLGGYAATVNVVQGTYAEGINILNFYNGRLDLVAVSSAYSSISGYLNIRSNSVFLVISAFSAINYNASVGLAAGTALIYVFGNSASTYIFNSSAYPGIALDGSGHANAWGLYASSGFVSIAGSTPGWTFRNLKIAIAAGSITSGAKVSIENTCPRGFYIIGGTSQFKGGTDYVNNATSKYLYETGILMVGTAINPVS